MSTQVTSRYYPTLDTVINTNDIPEVLGFIKNGIENLLGSMHFKDLQFSKSVYGDRAFYSLQIVSRDRLDIEVPGTGIFLVLNPDVTDSTISSFPITVQYEWPILGYVRSFNLDNFSFTPEDLFQLSLDILKISEAQVIANAINLFSEPTDPAVSSLSQFISDVNAQYALSIPEPQDTNNPIPEVLADLQTALGSELAGSIAVFATYLLNVSDPNDTITRINKFFRSLLPTNDIEQYIKHLILPKIKATLLLSAGIEFPRNMLKPVYDELGVNPTNPSDTGEALTVIPPDAEGNPKVLLGVGQALFYADTQEGLGYNLDLVLNTNTPAEIGNTGFVIDIQNLKIDLSRNSNIAEADLDNRPPEFVGVYTELTSVFLPKKWFKTETGQTLAITGRQLLIGTGGISGTIALRATYAVDQVGQVTDYFSEYFDLNFPLNTIVDGAPVAIADYTALLAHINGLANPYSLQFQFPLSLVSNTEVLSFANQRDYDDFINGIDPNKYLWFQLGKNEARSWRLGFNSFDLTLNQDAIVSSNLKARLELPKFKNSGSTEDKAIIDLVGHWYDKDNFSLTAAFLPTGLPINLFNIIQIDLLTADVGRQDELFFVGAATKISFVSPLMQSLMGGQKIEIPHLRIYENGKLELVGGNGFIPVNITLPLGPVALSVTGIHYGSIQKEYQGNMREYSYWGFDGAISIDPLGIDARGEGIKYYYTTDNDEYGGVGDDFLHISTIEVDLVIPGTASEDSALAIINGLLTLPEPGASDEFRGKVGVKLPKMNIAGGADMRMQPSKSAFIIEAGFDLPTAIPLGATGLGFYGFGGLLGYRYVADKAAVPGLEEGGTWYDYFTYPEIGVGVEKFVGPDHFEELGYNNPFSIGAGTVLATQFDEGKLFSLRLMALLSLPSVFILDGRANVLGPRLNMFDPQDPPFFAFVAIGDNSIEFGFGADYSLKKEEGYIFDLYAEAQAGFFFDNPKAWYINFGTRDNPITATLFKRLVKLRAESYLMLAAQGMEMGARVEFELKQRFGPAKIHIYAYVGVGVKISFERPQLGGYIALGGGIDIDIWVIGITLTLDALLSAEVSKPSLLYAEVRFKACAKILFVRVCKSFNVKLKFEKSKEVDRSPIPPIQLSPAANPQSNAQTMVKGVHMLTNEAFDLNYFTSEPSAAAIDKIIPLDTYIEFKSEKPLDPSEPMVVNRVGGFTNAPENHIELIPPEKVVKGGHTLRQVRHRYSIEDFEVKAWNGNAWETYHPFEATVPAANRPEVSDLRVGYWQKKGKQYDTLRVLATTPFTYMEAGEPGWVIPEMLGITPSTLYCSETLRTGDCSNVLNRELGTVFSAPSGYNAHFIDGAYYTLIGEADIDVNDGGITENNGDYMTVTNEANAHNFAKSLTINNYNSLEIILPEPSVQVRLKLTTYAEGVTIEYYGDILNDTLSGPSYELVHDEFKTAAQLDQEIVFEEASQQTIAKIVIRPKTPQSQRINELRERIAMLFAATYEDATGEVSITEPSDVASYNAYVAALEALKAESCTTILANPGCSFDAVVCELYDDLANIFQDCFISPVYTVQQLKDNLRCFHSFNEHLIEFQTNHPQYFLLQQFEVLYNDFAQKLDALNQALLYGSDFTAELLISMYYNLRECALQIVNEVYELGDCGCDGNPIDKCYTSLQEVCWVSLEDYDYNETIPGSDAIQAEHSDMVDALQKVAQPVWRPNTTYYIKYRLKDEVDNGQSSPGTFDYYYGFKTVGPIGHYHKHPEVNLVTAGSVPEEYPLASLGRYIDYRRSYPNADGSLLRAKPSFYGNGEFGINLYFVAPYVEHLLKGWNAYNALGSIEGSLNIAIKDPVSGVIVPYPLPIDFDEETVPVPDGAMWTSDTDPRIPVHLQALQNMIAHGDIPCQIDLGDPIVPASSYFNTLVTNLKPRKLYTAMIYNAFETAPGVITNEQIHEFVFQTSRYASFEEQVKSCLITNEDETLTQAVYDIKKSWTLAEIEEAYEVVTQPDTGASNLIVQYQDAFDRALSGVLGVAPLDDPETTEFNRLIDENTNEVIGLLIRNPEPFNNPKIPLEILKGDGNAENAGITVVFESSGAANDAYKVLYNKDYSQALVMHTSKKITAQQLSFKFIHKTWNGSEYINQMHDDGAGSQVVGVRAANILINE